jgi:hypothetical protein
MKFIVAGNVARELFTRGQSGWTAVAKASTIRPFPLFALLRPVDMNRSATFRPRPVHYWRWLVIAACIGWLAGNSHKAEVKSPQQGRNAAGAKVVQASTCQNGQ